MPTSEAPVNLNEPNEPDQQETKPKEESAGQDGSGKRARPSAYSGASRWVDYDSHELLQMISDLEDERRWARLREGFWIALLFHFLVISAVTWIPRYVFRVPPVIDPFTVIKNRKDLAYLDLPPDALKEIQQKPKVTPIPQKPVQLDKKMLDEMNKMTPPEPQKQPVTPPPIPPNQQSQIEAPKPAAVPARPNFAMNSNNPIDQLKRDMEAAARNRGGGADTGEIERNRMRQHPGAGTGGVSILSDTQGVDFSAWLQRFVDETQTTWDPLIPDEVNPPLSKQGRVMIRVKILPNGQIIPVDGIVLEGRSGDSGLDRAAWGALVGSNYPPLPHAFHGPFLELRVLFLYNIDPSQQR
jgi:outer membrane biosynthesis protein TonB